MFIICLMINSLTVIATSQQRVGELKNTETTVIEELQEVGIDIHELVNPKDEYEEPTQIPFGGFFTN